MGNELHQVNFYLRVDWLRLRVMEAGGALIWAEEERRLNAGMGQSLEKE